MIFDAILNRAPVAPVRLNPDLPSQLEAIINKALEKERELRCQSAAELRADLKRMKRELDSGKSAAVASAPVSARGWRPSWVLIGAGVSLFFCWRWALSNGSAPGDRPSRPRHKGAGYKSPIFPIRLFRRRFPQMGAF